MSRLHEPLQRHIHDEICSEVNDVIIRLKIHSMIGIGKEERDKIDKAKERHKEVTKAELIDLLSRVRDEMNECKMPYKKY